MFSTIEHLWSVDKAAEDILDHSIESLFASLEPSGPPWPGRVDLTETDTAILSTPPENLNPNHLSECQPVTYLSSDIGEAPFSPTVSPRLRPQPPRPPNPWILYRADKYNDIRDGKTVPNLELAFTQTMLSVPASKQRNILGCGTGLLHSLPQALLSKVVSRLWIWELPEVRQIYRHLSALRKLDVRNH
jgi:hypothetical protein